MKQIKGASVFFLGFFMVGLTVPAGATDVLWVGQGADRITERPLSPAYDRPKGTSITRVSSTKVENVGIKKTAAKTASAQKAAKPPQAKKKKHAQKRAEATTQIKKDTQDFKKALDEAIPAIRTASPPG